MAVTIEALRAYGTRRITIHCPQGAFEGSIVPKYLSDDTVMLLFALHDDPQTPIAIAVDAITEVVER